MTTEPTPPPTPPLPPTYHIQKLEQDCLLPESKVMTWFVQTALGLHYMHTNRVLHRDIKTQNVFILSSGRVVLGDLGISKASRISRTVAVSKYGYARKGMITPHAA